MTKQDTVRLLRECDAGIQMGISSIDEVLLYVKDEGLKRLLEDGKREHEKLKGELAALLEKYHDDGKEPPVMAKGMSWLKTNMKLVMKESDAAVADLITDGCNMGVKSLGKYLNQYPAAEPQARDIAVRLSKLEERLAAEMRSFL